MAGHGHGHGAHGHDDHGASNKSVALLIAILALLLAFSEMGGKYAEKEMVAQNLEASNFWAFFQAKTIRRTNVQVATEEMQARLPGVTDEALKASMEKRIAEWKKTADRYETEPETNEGRRELMARAKKAEGIRDIQKARNELFEGASALLQISIVLASAMIITGIAGLIWLAMGLGGLSILVMGAAVFRPEWLMYFLHH